MRFAMKEKISELTYIMDVTMIINNYKMDHSRYYFA